MDKKLEKIKKIVKKECEELGFVPAWFFEEHLKVVDKNAQWILEKVPEADREVVLLGTWLHDMQRVRGIKMDHQAGGAQEAEKIMGEIGYDNEVIEKVKNIILTHSCSGKMPTTIEGRVLATADAMAHYTTDFFLRIALLGDRTLEEYKKWALEKLEKNYNVKISFDFARDTIEDRHNTIKKFVEGE
jgi:HD superfamily phosphodiesterase